MGRSAPATILMTEVAVQVHDNSGARRYEARLGEGDDRLAGFARYVRRGDRIVFIHTEVLPKFEGHGVGAALARGALDDVRARGLRVVPMCPFIAAYIRRHPEFADLVDTSRTPQSRPP